MSPHAAVFHNRRSGDLRVALLTHVLTPHRLHLFESVAQWITHMRVLISSAWDEPHKFALSRGALDVTVQKSWNWTHRFHNRHGYSDVSFINVPYDTFHQLLRFRPDVVISTECGIRSVLSVLYRIAHPRSSLILWAQLTEHTEAARGGIRDALRRWMVRHVDAIFVNGKSGETYLRSLGYAGDIFLVPYTIESGIFASEAYLPAPGTRRLLYTGQLIERKGLRLFCSVLAQWCRDNPSVRITFRIVGDGPERPAIEAMPKPANLTIELCPGVTQEQLARHYHEADIYAFPSRGDEWGVVVNEAMIAGLPVLGSRFSGAAAELIDDGVNGWLFSSYDGLDIYHALDRALSVDVAALCAMSEQAKKTIAGIAPPIVAANIVRAIERCSKKEPSKEGSASWVESEAPEYN